MAAHNTRTPFALWYLYCEIFIQLDISYDVALCTCWMGMRFCRRKFFVLFCSHKRIRFWYVRYGQHTNIKQTIYIATVKHRIAQNIQADENICTKNCESKKRTKPDKKYIILYIFVRFSALVLCRYNIRLNVC